MLKAAQIYLVQIGLQTNIYTVIFINVGLIGLIFVRLQWFSNSGKENTTIQEHVYAVLLMDLFVYMTEVGYQW